MENGMEKMKIVLTEEIENDEMSNFPHKAVNL